MATTHLAWEAAKTDAKRFDAQYKTHQFSNAVENISWAAEWADGRETPKGGIAYADWNDIGGYRGNEYSERARTLMKRLGNILEKLGVELEWSDQVSTCDGCDRLIQTEPDCYFWQPEFEVGDGEITCTDCLDPEEYLERLEGGGLNAIASIDPAEHGYRRLNEESYESGWHPGQNDDPRKVAKELKAKGLTRFLFHKDEQSQFYSRWSVYLHEDDWEKFQEDELRASRYGLAK